jgi:hypothetical protein
LSEIRGSQRDPGKPFAIPCGHVVNLGGIKLTAQLMHMPP